MKAPPNDNRAMRELLFQFLTVCGHTLSWRDRAMLLKELVRLDDMVWAAEQGVPIEITYIERTTEMHTS